MPTRSTYARTLLAGLLLLAGCGEEKTVGATAAGSLSFTYNGRSFEAVGRYTGPTGLQEEFAAADRRVGAGGESRLDIIAVDKTPGNLSRLQLNVPDQAGEYRCPPTQRSCAFSFAFETGLTGGSSFYDGPGVVRIIELTSDRVKGTFSLVYPEGVGTGSFETVIENGSFDVPILRSSSQ